MNSDHKATNESFRKGYDVTFGRDDMLRNLREKNRWERPQSDMIGDMRDYCKHHGGDCGIGQYCSTACYERENDH